MLEVTFSTWPEIDGYLKTSKRPTVFCVLSPVEEHASHLPCGTDYLIAEAITKRIAKEFEDCVLFPTIPLMCCGISRETTGSYPISDGTLKVIVGDLIKELLRKNFQRIIFFSVHGGYSIKMIQEVIDEFEKFYPEKKGFARVYRFPHIVQQATKESKRDFHAGWIETSLMMYLFPDLVAKELPPADYHQKEEGIISASGIDGDPTKASQEKGEALFEIIISDTLEWLKSI